MSSSQPDLQFEALLDYLRQNRGFDFTGYKRSSLMRRVQKRMQPLEIETYSQYQDYLEVTPEEFITLFNTILINVTAFFRDPNSWEGLKQVLSEMLAKKRPNQPIRAWTAGCASGEEPYTLAIILAEALGIDAFRDRVKIFATDVDEEALYQARQGSYTPKELEAVPPDLRQKYFEPVANRYTFLKDLRRCVIFGRHDLVKDAPISRVDLLTCRNALMYFNTETQTKILERFHFALNSGGYVFLGKAEMLFTRSNLFTPVDLRQRIFTKVRRENLRDRYLLRTQADQKLGSQNSDTAQIWESAFNTDPVAQLVIDTEGTLALANDRARSLFGLKPANLGQPLQDLELSYRPVELRSLIEQATNQCRPLHLKDIPWETEGTARWFDLMVIPLQDARGTLLGTKVLFTNITRYKQLQEELASSTQELETAYEELQSTNEELETTNEELQSTNEELETMNEELQSTNEELATINEEMRDRSQELNQVNGFLGSILTSLESGVVVLDQDLQIQIWNYKAEDLWGLRADEVKGSHFLNLDIGLPVQQLRQPIRACLSGGALSEKCSLEATNRRGRAIHCQVTCTPLMEETSEVKGAILLMAAVELDPTAASSLS